MKYAVYKIVSAFSVYPVASDNEMFVCKLFYIVLSGSLGTAVNSQRIGIVKLCIRFFALSVENIICGKLDDLCPAFSCHDA